jgi:predicted transcriptional regulator
MLDVKDIKATRMRVGLTQAQLAGEAGVSQSVIAKIEAGRIDPGYSLAQRILAALERHRRKNAPKAKDVMHKKIVVVKPSAAVAQAIKLMRKHGISQLPVQDVKVIGIITETTILNHLHALNKKVSDIMEVSPPTLAPDADIAVVSALLQHYPLVLIVDRGKPVGIVTKADVLTALV